MGKLKFDLIKIGEEAQAELFKAFEDAAEDLMNEAKRNAPISTGKLKNSITKKTLTNKKGSKLMAVGPDLDYGFFVEVGANDKAPRPFMGRAYISKRDKLARDMIKAANDVISKHNNKNV